MRRHWASVDTHLMPAISWLGTVGSTNEEAFLRAGAGDRGPLWIAASQQTGGRGRSGRHWVSPPGNLYASLLLTYPRPLPTVAQLSLVAGLAAHQTLASLAPAVRFELKWPNDVLCAGAKLCGILIEGRTAPDNAGHNVVVGIGINLAHHPELPGRQTTSLSALGTIAEPTAALDHLVAAFESWRDVWGEGAGMAQIRRAFMARSLPEGTVVSVNAGPEMINGRFAGLDTDGALLVGLPGGGQRRITFGDVHIGTPAGVTS